MSHALIIGGSGMLKGTSIWLASRYDYVTVIGRSKKKMDSLINQCNNIKPLYLDYHDTNNLKVEIEEQIRKLGHIDLIVAWIHSTAPTALFTIINTVSKQHNNWSLVHILGSSSNLETIKKNISVPENCSYSQVQLGFIRENNQARWLTNTEISFGVIKAISQKEANYIVGTIEPWEQRPS
ncbi:short-chain dehydrogenase [Lysinibacillus odysseyi]|uniref:Short-chain dehydrogenase n=1 Tax=Lysinibacillus odysseyi 34hs-1 = NBRC 100172 TaxID=1220589 RepID=A0A0A3IPW8_9BACI|nr:short-chain dehydrogenase [Lysinibacillus odysseyi]KGR85525.1 hypothetical protein CD32_09945 [Lysinibacillus odysseyi 34hs-1 = NBRC 100172]